MNLIDEYYKPENYIKSLSPDMVEDFQNYITNNSNENKDIVEGYVETLNTSNKNKTICRRILKNFLNKILIHNICNEEFIEQDKKYLINVVDDGRTVDSVIFVDNLTVPTDPPYNNFNGRIGLTRCTSERFEGELVICYFYPERQEDSYAEFITEEEAYHMCAHRNKLDLAKELGIVLTQEREIIELNTI